MSSETKYEMSQLSETDLDRVSGGDLLDAVDWFLRAAFGIDDGHGNGPINHFRGNGGHYKN